MLLDDGWWLRIQRGLFFDGSRSAPATAVMPPDLVVVFARPRPGAVREVLESVEQALRRPPLALRTDLRNEVVLGRADFRLSPILQRPPPWREHVRLVFMGSERQREVRLELDLTMYINAQATAREEDWHLPTQPQLAHYGSAVLDEVRRELEHFCPRARWRDSRTLLCR